MSHNGFFGWYCGEKTIKQIVREVTVKVDALLKTKKNFADAFSLAGDLAEDIHPRLRLNKNEKMTLLVYALLLNPLYQKWFKNSHIALKGTIFDIFSRLSDFAVELTDISSSSAFKTYLRAFSTLENLETDKALRQKLIAMLCNKIANFGFLSTAKQFGVVCTPVEIVDFCIKSCFFLIEHEFNLSFNSGNISFFDPFAGSGIFLARIIELLPENQGMAIDMYNRHILGCEILPPFYMIAEANLKAACEELINFNKSLSSPNIVLGDTFGLNPWSPYDLHQKQIIEKVWGPNLSAPQCRIIITNPPFSPKTTSKIDDKSLEFYTQLSKKLKRDFIDASASRVKSGLYNNSVWALRWMIDALGSQGIICSIFNQGLLQNCSFDGIRKFLVENFNKIYILNLRGNCFSTGEIRKKEGGKIFESGSKLGFCMLFLVKQNSNAPCQVFYGDIGESLSRHAKIEKLSVLENIKNVEWHKIDLCTTGNWIYSRKESSRYPSLPFFEKNETKKGIFIQRLWGLRPRRLALFVNSSKNNLLKSVKTMHEIYLKCLADRNFAKSGTGIESITKDKTCEKLTTAKALLVKRIFKESIEAVDAFKDLQFDDKDIVSFFYKPFCKKFLYDHRFSVVRNTLSRIAPIDDSGQQLFICVTSKNSKREVSALATKLYPEHKFLFSCRVYPLYITNAPLRLSKPPQNKQNRETSDCRDKNPIVKTVNINPNALAEFKNFYNDESITEYDIFSYIYAVLHWRRYKEEFFYDLNFGDPSLPLIKNIRKFITIGQKLIDLHTNYEKAPPYPLKIMHKSESLDAAIAKATKNKRIFFPKKQGYFSDKTKVIIGNIIEISEIPEKSTKYTIEGLCPIEWIVLGYTLKKETAASPEDSMLATPEGVKYLLNLIPRLVTVSLETLKLIEELDQSENF